MATYKEQIKDRKSYVLVKNGEVLATFGNLKKVSEYLDGEDFYSYHTLVRKDFPIEYGPYEVFKVRHY